MVFEEAKILAQKGIKIRHAYFTEDEYLTMRENVIVFEDGVKMYEKDWLEGKDFLLDGWSIYPEN